MFSLGKLKGLCDDHSAWHPSSIAFRYHRTSRSDMDYSNISAATRKCTKVMGSYHKDHRSDFQCCTCPERHQKYRSRDEIRGWRNHSSDILDFDSSADGDISYRVDSLPIARNSLVLSSSPCSLISWGN